MIPLTLAQIAEITGGELRGDPAAVVTGEVVIDSRRAGPGGLFAAVAGERADGHDFAPAAVAAGAVAVLATRPVPVPSVLVTDVPAALAALAKFVIDALPAAAIAGITGSSGKTTTKDLAAQLVERLGPTIAPAGSFNNEFGHPLTVLRADAATRYLVLELSARGPGHIAYLCRVAPPRYGVVLNVGHAHAGEFGGLDQVARAKGELVEALPADGAAILNADDPRVLAMAARTAARVVTFGVDDRTALIRAAGVRLDDLGRPSFTLLTPEGQAGVTLRLHGAHNVPDAVAAAALARELGLGLADIADGLCAAVARSRWRMEVRRREDGVTVINDAYNANPESVRAALQALRHLAQDGRGFAILGHMAELGDTSRASHEDIGEFAAQAELAGLIAVGDEAAPILAGARRVRSWTGEALAVPDGTAALDALANQLKPGDVVLVKASRAAHLEGVAADIARRGRPGEDRPVVRSRLVVLRAVRHPAGHQGLHPARLRPGDQVGRAGRAPVQARHADHGRHGDHHRVAGRLPRRPPGHRRRHVRVRAAGAVPDDRARPGRVRRRLHQALHAAQPGPAQRGQAGRPGHRGRDLRGAGDQVPRRVGHHPGVHPPVLLRGLRHLHRPGAVRGLGHPHGVRDLQRREPHRRAGRPGHRRGHSRARRLHDHRHLAAAQRLHGLHGQRLLRTSATRRTWPSWPPP